MNLSRSIARLKELSSEVAAGNIGIAQPWQGADVIITEDLPVIPADSFYPAPTIRE